MLDVYRMYDLRDIVLQAYGGTQVWRLTDEKVIERATNLLACGELIACNDTGNLGLREDQARSDDYLAFWRRLPLKNGGFHQHGQSYRIIAAYQWRSLDRKSDYELVGAADARIVIKKLAADPTWLPEHRTLFEQAAHELCEPHRDLERGGVLLLRRRHSSTGHANRKTAEAAASTSKPSALGIRERHWIEIELLSEQGHGVSGARYVIVTPDKQEHSGYTDQHGLARLDGLVPGNCRISFPEIDRDAWRQV